MIDDDLRARFDALASQVSPAPDAEQRVRSRAHRLRRTRQQLGLTGVVAVVAACVTVPVALHRSTTDGAAVAIGGRPAGSCSQPLSTFAATLGDVQHVYGEQVTVGSLLSWDGPGADAAASALSPGTTVELCLVVGELHATPAPAGSGGSHYALAALLQGKPVLLYAAVDQGHLPTSPLPGVARSTIDAFDPGGAFVHLGAEASQSGGAAPAASDRAPVRSCTSSDLDPEPQPGHAREGVLFADVDLVNLSGSACAVSGDVTLALLAGDGSALAAPPHGVLAPMPVHGIIQVKGSVVVEVGGDQPSGDCTSADLVTPARLALTVGRLSVTVENRATDIATGRTSSLSGCPGRIYADRAEVY